MHIFIIKEIEKMIVLKNRKNINQNYGFIYLDECLILKQIEQDEMLIR